MNKYSALDGAICAWLADGLCHPVNSPALVEMARQLMTTPENPHRWVVVAMAREIERAAA